MRDLFRILNEVAWLYVICEGLKEGTTILESEPDIHRARELELERESWSHPALVHS